MAVGGAAKVGVFAPFPVKDQLPGVDFCVSSSPSWPEAILLGFQHYLVMLGTTVIIPSIFVLLISRFNTWFGTRLPVVIGGSYAFSIPTITISLSTNNSTNVIFLTPHQVKFSSLPHFLAKCVEIGILALLFVVFISQLYGHMPAVLTVAGAYNNKHPDTQLSSRVDRAGLISAAPWIKVPYPFQWGRPTFDAGDVFAMMAACFVAIVESTGTIIEVSRYGSATPLPPSVLSRGIGWLYSFQPIHENAGLLGLTRVGSRRVVQISAGFMLFFSVLSAENSGLFLLPIPLPIVAALYCVLFAYAVLQLNSFRTKFILGFSLFLGLPVPQYFKEYLLVSGRGPFNDIMQLIFSSPATVAILVACFLDCTHSLAHSTTRRDSGRHWWERFRYFSGRHWFFPSF
ncbi:hypothetical protein BDE02_01G261700 [Populus trichocarpa]|nr:hypothetical protein BDE02_01G261700 [Populus trichocarpa]